MEGSFGKNQAQTDRGTEHKRGQKVYAAGIYARLSVDSHNEKNESIESQIEIAKYWMESQPDMALYGCYSDLGKSGTSFERKGFQRLMEDVRLRKVNCVIVKDFSRFGRNYIEMGNYIQKIFPFLGVRFVSVTDHFDSLYEDEDSLGTNLKNLANEMYARDIAVKVKTAKKIQRERGSYTGGVPPYGYRAEWREGRKCLLIERETSGIVKEIYRLWEDGSSRKEVAEWLYRKKVHRPKEYHHYGHVFWQEGEALREWSGASLRLILTNPVYMGDPAGRTCGRGHESGKKDNISSGDEFIGNGIYPAIVTRKQFLCAAGRFGKRQQERECREEYKKAAPQGEDIFEGLLFCGECGGRLGRACHMKELPSGGRRKEYGYFCRRSTCIDSFACERKYIAGNKLQGLVKTALRQEIRLRDMRMEGLAERFRQGIGEKRRKLETELESIRRREEAGKRKGSELYLKYWSGEAGREMFLGWKERAEKEEQEYRSRKDDVLQKIRKLEETAAGKEKFLRTLFRFDGESEPDRALLSALIDKIHIFPGKRIVITYRFHGIRPAGTSFYTEPPEGASHGERV